jgi:hypothetical protein
MIVFLIQLATSAGLVAVAVLTPSKHCLNGKIGAHKSWAHTEDRAARTAPARAALMRRFEDQVDPGRTLPAEERARRAESARKAHFAALAAKSAASRARNKGDAA